MRHGEPARGKVGKDWLDIARGGAPGSRIPVVSDGHAAGQPLAHVGPGEVFAHEPQMTLGMKAALIIAGHAAGLLAAVLQGVESEGAK